MQREKHIRDKGKLQLSRYFQELQPGENVAVMKEVAINSSFPRRLQGSTGIIESKRGHSYIVKIRTQGKEKRFVIAPIHLKKIKQI